MLTFIFQPIATNFGCKKSDIAVKEQIIYDLNQYNFLSRIDGIINVRNPIDLKCLNLDEIMFLVKSYENYESRENLERYLQKLENDHIPLLYNKDCCGRWHRPINKCSASGQRCYKCNGLNHFAKTCKRLYIRDDRNCGISHAEKQCEAFGKQCSRCGKFNHFYWSCFPSMKFNCQNCGTSHLDLATKCAAYGRSCSKCLRVGHLSIMCHRYRRR